MDEEIKFFFFLNNKMKMPILSESSENVEMDRNFYYFSMKVTKIHI